MTHTKLITVHLSLQMEVPAGLSEEQTKAIAEHEAQALTGVGGKIASAEIRSVEADPAMKNWTVLFFIDADKGVERFREEVVAVSEVEAWDLAVDQARESGCSSTGHSIGEWEWEHATEIATLRGHNLSDYDMDRLRRAKADAALKAERGVEPQPTDPIFGLKADVAVAAVGAYDEAAKAWNVTDANGHNHLVRSIDDDWHVVSDSLAKAA